MKLKFWQVDAFTDKALAGNPAAVNDAWPRTVAFLKRNLN